MEHRRRKGDCKVIETKRKDLDKNIRLLNEEGYAVTLHCKQGKYYIKKQLKAGTEKDKINEERGIIK